MLRIASKSWPRMLKAPNIGTERMSSTVSSGPLMDSFGRKHNYLRISLTERCNLRCIYCMPEEGVQLTPNEKLLSSAEIGQICEMFVKELGVTKIRLTGGEPTIRKDIVDIMKRLNGLKTDGSGLKDIAMTTNGIVFGRYCQTLKDNGLDSVNISLDTLDPVKYQLITRKNGLSAVLKSIDRALEADFKSVKINCVPMKNMNDDELFRFIDFTRNKDVEVRFIEYMPFDGNKWNEDKMLSYNELMNRIREQYSFQRLSPVSVHETSQVFQVDGFKGRFGMIASMSVPFCSGCNRLRITADGNLKVCLFDQRELSIRDLLRNGTEHRQIVEHVRAALFKKKKQHSGAINISKTNSRPMILIANAKQFQTGVRFASNFTHIHPDSGRTTMVNVADKTVTRRTAIARATIDVGKIVMQKIQQNKITKGDVLCVAKIAGILGSKRTAGLIPLCHQISLADVQVDYELLDTKIIVHVTVVACDKTGVEMEALTGATIVALTIYDMCKAVNKSIVIQNVHLVSKTGGKSGSFHFKECSS